MAKSPHLSRNEFVKVIVGAIGSIIGAVIGLPAIGYILSPALQSQKADSWIPLGPLDKIPVGIPTPFNFTRTRINGWERTANSYGVFIWRKTEAPEDVVVFSSTCTHLSCRVAWKEELQEYICPCHDAHFAIDGAIITGPQPRPLDQYSETKIEEGNLMIHFLEG